MATLTLTHEHTIKKLPEYEDNSKKGNSNFKRQFRKFPSEQGNQNLENITTN